VQPFPDLRGVQSLFWRLLSAPEGVGKGAKGLRRAGVLESEDLCFLVRPDARLGPVERLDIYADMYFYRLRDCLAEDFPKVAAQIGEARFHNLATDYLLAHPSTHFSLRQVGRTLPGFLRTHLLEREFPALADLAQLEWARVDVFDDADAVPLSRQELLERGGAAPEKFALALIPSARLLRVDASVLPLWRRLDGAGAAEEDGERKRRVRGETRGVRVWRKGFSVFHRSLPADAEHCLRALAAGGATLAQLGELLLEQQPPGLPPERAAQRLAALLDLWASDELLTSHGSRSSR
jgi:hypothetical protein